MAATPNSATSPLPINSVLSKGATPERAPPPQVATDGNVTTGVETPPTAPAAQDSPVSRTANGTPGDKAEREKAKKKDKKERKEREKADKDKESATPKSVSTPTLPEASPAGANSSSEVTSIAGGPKSPVTEAGSPGGARTPKTLRPQRHPWTIFMRLQVQTQEPFSDAEVKEFFGEAGNKVSTFSFCIGGDG